MKKAKFFIPFFISGIITLCLAQRVPDNAIDFTAKDVNGTNHSLFTYLTAGKYVLLDFVTTG